MAAHRYWRLTKMTGASSFIAMSEVQFRTAVGVPLAFSGGTANSSASLSGTYPVNLTDGNTGTNWFSNYDVGPGVFWSYDYGAGNAIDVAEVAVTATTGTGYTPHYATLQYSDNGSLWLNYMTGAFTSWSSLQTQTFSTPYTLGTEDYGTTTWNPADTDGAGVLSNGNLTLTKTAASYSASRSTTGHVSGKHYFEVTVGSLGAGNAFALGLAQLSAALNNIPGGLPDLFDSLGYTVAAGKFRVNNQSAGTALTVSAGTVFGIALDMDNFDVWIRVGAGLWNNDATADPATNTRGLWALYGASYRMALDGKQFAMLSCNNGSYGTANFGATAFVNGPPSGFLSWDAAMPVEDYLAILVWDGAKSWPPY